MPRSWLNGTANGETHVAQAAFVAWSTWSAAMHVPVTPVAHAACSASRSPSVQRFWSVGVTGVAVPGAQPAYGAGQVFCWLLQTRGSTRPLHVEPACVQFVHALPPEPHALFAKPGTHALFAVQQPAAQVAGPHLSRHWRPWQTWFVAVQSLHCWPFVGPHALSCVPTTHVLPAQQPAQFWGPHAGSWQLPPWQTRDGFCPVQFEHSAPFRPHAVFWLPIAQMFPMQQPGQFAGLHCAAGTHAPLLHASPAPHCLHTAPPAPHACAVVAITQLFPTQHPAQFAALHVVCAWQVLSAAHTRLVEPQLVHAAPWRPHAVVSEPVTHWPFAVQQPAQFCGPHAGVPSH